MVKEAEANKAEDEKKRKDIETRNKAEQMINEIDKALAEPRMIRLMLIKNNKQNN